MNRARWAEWVSYPSWSCPTCQKGSLRLDSKSVHTTTSRSEQRERQMEPYANPERVDRLTGHLICDDRPCGETATFAGDILTFRLDLGDDGEHVETSYRARSIVPSPLPFPVDSRVPKAVATLIREAAALYWVDPAGAISRVREVIGAILTERGVAETGTKDRRLSLHERIELFGAVDGGQWLEQAEIIEAAKWIGNDATHATVTREAALDAFEMLETALDDIYVRTRHALLEKVRSTNTLSRKPRRPKP